MFQARLLQIGRFLVAVMANYICPQVLVKDGRFTWLITFWHRRMQVLSVPDGWTVNAFPMDFPCCQVGFLLRSPH